MQINIFKVYSADPWTTWGLEALTLQAVENAHMTLQLGLNIHGSASTDWANRKICSMHWKKSIYKCICIVQTHIVDQLHTQNLIVSNKNQKLKNKCKKIMLDKVLK